MFSDVTFKIETFSTNMAFTTLSKWIFTRKRHLKQCNVKSVKNISRRNENNGIPSKEAPTFFWFLWGDFNISDIFLQNPSLILMSYFPNNHYWAYTFLNPWALFPISYFCQFPLFWISYFFPPWFPTFSNLLLILISYIFQLPTFLFPTLFEFLLFSPFLFFLDFYFFDFLLFFDFIHY